MLSGKMCILLSLLFTAQYRQLFTPNSWLTCTYILLLLFLLRSWNFISFPFFFIIRTHRRAPLLSCANDGIDFIFFDSLQPAIPELQQLCFSLVATRHKNRDRKKPKKLRKQNIALNVSHVLIKSNLFCTVGWQRLFLCVRRSHIWEKGEKS